MRCWRSYQRSTTCPTSPRRRLNAPRTSWSASRSANAWTHSSLRCGARSRSSTSGSRCACIVFACICTVKLCALCDAIVKFVFQRVNWPSPLRWRSCRRPCSLTTSLIPGPSWPTPPPTAWLYGVCVCCYLFFVSRRLTYVVQRCFSFSLCVSGIMMCCSAVRSWTAGLRTSLCRVLSGCLDFSTHSPSSLVTHIHACSQQKNLSKSWSFISCIITPLLWPSSGDAVSGT